jgi:cytochrome c oxidase subunit 4
MAERIISVRTYVIVCVILILLTVLTTAMSFINMVPGVWHIVVGLIIGLCKATLVVLFFMHAIISNRVTWIVIIVSSFWLGILLVLTLTDYFSRNMVPFTPGH